MDFCKQKTLRGECFFEGKGLHTGKVSHITIKPAPADTGILFHRTDLGPDAFVQALSENVSSTARSTTISCGETSVVTIEHLMSALTGFGIDNALIEIDNVEVPILDGSARFYSEAFGKDGLLEQDAPRKLLGVREEILFSDEESGSWIKVSPSTEARFSVTVDFGSKVLGVQEASWTPEDDYAREIAPCRTFVFFHELEFLFNHNLIKGGDVDNAIVIVEHPVSGEQLSRLSSLFGVPSLSITEGYLDNLSLHFRNECGRHKLLDLIGDIRLCGGFLCAKVEAFKPGHAINTAVARKIREKLVYL